MLHIVSTAPLCDCRIWRTCLTFGYPVLATSWLTVWSLADDVVTCQVCTATFDSSCRRRCCSCQLLCAVACQRGVVVAQSWRPDRRWYDDPSLTSVVVDRARWCRGYAGHRSAASDWTQSAVLHPSHIIKPRCIYRQKRLFIQQILRVAIADGSTDADQ